MSLFHSLKKAVSRKPAAGATIEDDAVFLEYREKFESLLTSATTLYAQVDRYKAAVSSLISHAHAISQDFARLLNDPNHAPHPYTQMAQDLGRTHAQTLNTSKSMVLMHAVVELLEKPLQQQLESYRAIKQRLLARQTLLEEAEYYKTKLEGLKRGTKPDEIAKYDRNVQKCDEAQNKYLVTTKAILVDMKIAWDHRVMVLGPAMAGFVGVENQLTQFYSHAIRGITEVDVVEATKVLKTNYDEAIKSDIVAHNSLAMAVAEAEANADASAHSVEKDVEAAAAAAAAAVGAVSAAMRESNGAGGDVAPAASAASGDGEGGDVSPGSSVVGSSATAAAAAAAAAADGEDDSNHDPAVISIQRYELPPGERESEPVNPFLSAVLADHASDADPPVASSSHHHASNGVHHADEKKSEGDHHDHDHHHHAPPPPPPAASTTPPPPPQAAEEEHLPPPPPPAAATNPFDD